LPSLHWQPLRVLEESLETKNLTQGCLLAAKTPEFAQILNSMDVPIYSVVLSSDCKIVYASLFDGTFHTINISDPTSPVFIASKELGKLNPPEIVLSLDGKTIFVANSEHLRMINVSDSHSPLIVNSLIFMRKTRRL